MRGLLFVLVALAYVRAAVAVDQISVYYDAATKTYSIKSGYDATAVAAGSFDDQLDDNGWTFLKIVSNETYTAEEQYFASGMVEGYLTAEQLDFYGVNQFEDWGFTQATTPPALSQWMQENLDYMRAGPPPNRAHADKLDDSIWVEVALIVQQIDGIVDGYNRAKNDGRSRMREVWSALDIWMLIMAGDMEDLVPLFKGQIPHYDDPTMMDCSAIVRLTPASAGPQDLIVAHNTWRSFMIMNRVYKKLTINGITTAFSSSPCFISSKDDFYITHYDLVIYETTNNIFNTTLYELLTPKSLLTSVRNVVADRGAANGQEWTDIFGRYNSGTYNNQFGVIDMKLFSTFLSQPEKDDNGHSRKLVANTFWIIEQIPGYTRAADVTYQLNLNGFWPSYNIPFFTDIYSISGYIPKAAASPIDYSYTESFRALLFDKLAPKTDSFEDIQWLIRYNEWKNDAASVGDPAKSLASRYDLRPDGFSKKAAAFGAVDAKVTSYRRLFGSGGTEESTFGAAIVSGPTAQDNAMTPPFRWDNPKWVNISHAGLPIVWDFDWVDVEKVSIFQ